MTLDYENSWQTQLLADIYAKNTKPLEKKILAVYAKANKSMNAEINKLWLRMLEDGEISPSTLYKNNRYMALQGAIQKELYTLGASEQASIQLSLMDDFKQSYIGTNSGYGINTKWTAFNEILANQIVNRDYKGATFSERIWKNKDTLRQQLERKIVDTAIGGQDVRRAAGEIRDRFGVAYSDAEALMRTETMRTLNDGQRQSYRDNGYERLEILVAEDERTCSVCGAKVGLIVDIDSSDIPPFHTRCRCTHKPVLEV